jgi:outer membrane protein OmpA-like peptidoglycan-associated protein
MVFSIGNALYTSPGWSYGYELGAALGDNTPGGENLAPLVRGHVELEILPMLYARVGLGYTALRAPKRYSTSLGLGDYRFVVRPLRHAKFSPFAYIGTGAAIDMKESVLDVMPLFPIGIGFQTGIKRGMQLEVTAGYNLVNSDVLDNIERTENNMNTFTGKKQDGFYGVTVGLSYFNPGPKKAQPTPPPPPPVVVTPPKTPTLAVVPPPPPPPVVVIPPKPPVKEVQVVVPDPKTLDSDGDGLSDYDEINIYKTDPKNPDTDGEGLNDYVEVMTHKTNPLNPDTDGEGLNDYAEVMTHKTNPLNPDTDGEGLNDYAEVMTHKTNPLNPDTDGEGLNDYAEVTEHKTNPLVVDTDGDGLNDYVEVMQYKTNPLDKDTDKGSIEDGAEVKAGTDPLNIKDDVMELEVGKTFNLEGIMFETAKSIIKPESIPILEKAYIALSTNPNVNIIIHGHTDNVGSASSNMTLSQNRANSVMNWLIAKGIAATRMKAVGLGLTQPRATNATVEGRQLNRRIDFEIVE